MGGATSVMPAVIRNALSQQAADTSQWADKIVSLTGRYAVTGCKLQVSA